MSEGIRQAGFTDGRDAGEFRSRRYGAGDSALVLCDATEETGEHEASEHRRWMAVQIFFENHVLKRMVVTLLRAIDALKVRLPERHLVALVRDLRLIESNAADSLESAPLAAEGRWLAEPPRQSDEIVGGSVSERLASESAAAPVRESATTAVPRLDRRIERNVRAYGPEPEPVPQAELIAQYEHLMRK